MGVSLLISNIALLILLAQTTTYGIPATEPPKEGFADDDTYITFGLGISPKEMKSPLQAEATAKEMARVDAQRKFAELVRNDGRACGQTRELTAEMKDIMGATRRYKVLHAQCSLVSDQPPAQECKVWISIRAKGLKKIVEENKQDGRGQAVGCGQ